MLFLYNSFTLSFSIGHYQKIGIIPKGVRNIQIKELAGFKNFLGKILFCSKFL